ncbi:MAG TPA: gliding motility lipoprotein GldB [Chryseolinea sp.]
MSKYFVPFIFLLLVVAACNSEKEEACVFQPEQSPPVSLSFEMLQDSLVNISSKGALIKFLTRHHALRDHIFRRAEYQDDSVFVNALYERLTNPHMDTLNFEIKRVFGDATTLKSQFEEAFANIKYYYPDFTPPKVQTVISGLLDNDLLVTDSLIIVSLDYFLGRDAKYRPKFYDYLLRKYDPNDIVPSCMLIYGIGSRFNKSQQNDQTVLADMITYGKAFYFAKHMLPCEPDSVFIWYTPEEISGSRQNEHLIWARFIESQVLFSTNKKVKQDYLGERPVTIQVGEKCPGRIGQWVGWRIVNKYAESHPEVTLPRLMALEDAQKIFKESRYKPQ